MDNSIGQGFRRKMQNGETFIQFNVRLGGNIYHLLLFKNSKREPGKCDYYVKTKIDNKYAIVGSGWLIVTDKREFVSMVLTLDENKYKILMFKRKDYEDVKDKPGEYLFNFVLKQDKPKTQQSSEFDRQSTPWCNYN